MEPSERIKIADQLLLNEGKKGWPEARDLYASALSEDSRLALKPLALWDVIVTGIDFRIWIERRRAQCYDHGRNFTHRHLKNCCDQAPKCIAANQCLNHAGRCSQWQKQLSSKVNVYDLAMDLKVPVPDCYYSGSSVKDLMKIVLPDSYVIKPTFASTGDGVKIVEQGLDQDGVDFSSENIRQHVEAINEAAKSSWLGREIDSTIMVEQLVKDEIPNCPVPRDFKVHCFGGKPFFIQLIDRNSKPLATQGFYTPAWDFIAHPLQYSYRPGGAVSKPRDLDEMMKHSATIASTLDSYCRLDFYSTTDGPVLGEITLGSQGGLEFSNLGNRLLGQLWTVYHSSEFLLEFSPSIFLSDESFCSLVE